MITEEKELEIIKKIQMIAHTAPAIKRAVDLKALQIAFFVKAISNIYLSKSNETYSDLNNFSELCSHLYKIDFSSDIKADGLVNRNYIVIVNHHGIGKLTKIKKEDVIQYLDEEIRSEIKINNLINNDPFPIIFAPIIYTIKQLFNKKIVFLCTRFDEPYNRILEDCGCFIGDREQKNNFSFIREKYNCLLDEVENDTVLGIYPEVGTSGKREGKSPYDLSAFRTGFAYLSYEFKIPVLPIVQVFDEFLNIHIKVLNPVSIKKPKSDALLIKSEMQKAINLTIENL